MSETIVPKEIKIYIPSMGRGVIILSDMEEDERVQLIKKYKFYERMSDDLLEVTLNGLITAGRRILAKYRGTKSGAMRNKNAKALYETRLNQLYKDRIDNAIDKAIVRHILEIRSLGEDKP